jgi:hypothetical protein
MKLRSGTTSRSYEGANDEQAGGSVRTAVRTKTLQKPVGSGKQRSTSALSDRSNRLVRGTI